MAPRSARPFPSSAFILMEFALLLLVGLLCAAALFTWGIVRDARSPSRATIGWALARKLPVDPAALNIEFTESTWAANQPTWVLRGGSPSSDITTIIIHGWRRSRIDSLRRIHPWLSRSSSLWLLDLAGHGDAPPGPTTLGVRDVDDLVRLARTLLAQGHATSAPPTRLLFIGHSLGASIAARAAARLDPASLAGLVAFAPYESLAEPLESRLRSQALPAVPFARLAELWLHALCGREASVTRALAVLHANQVPLLIVASGQDTVVSRPHVEKVAEAAQVTLVIDELSTHDELGSSCDAKATTPCARALHAFLEKIATTSPVVQSDATTRIEQ